MCEFHTSTVDSARPLCGLSGQPGIRPSGEVIGALQETSANSLPRGARRPDTRRGFIIDGAPPLADGERPPALLWASVTDDYFRTLLVPVLQGRTFDTCDRAGAVPEVVISEGTARRYWPSGGALGSRIRLADMG
jgi:hypothetical protein